MRAATSPGHSSLEKGERGTGCENEHALRQRNRYLSYRIADTCEHCGATLWVAYHTVRTVTTLDGLCQLLLTIRRCHNPTCEHYHRPYRPEEEGGWALPHGEFGLDIIALIGTLRYSMHHSMEVNPSGTL